MIVISTTSDMLTQEKHQSRNEYTITAKMLSCESVFEDGIRAIMPGELIWIKFTDTGGQITGYAGKVLEYFCSKDQTEILRLKMEFKIFVPEATTDTPTSYTVVPGLTISRIMRYKDMLAVYFSGDAKAIFSDQILLRTEFTEKYSSISYLGQLYHAITVTNETSGPSLLAQFSYAKANSESGEGVQYCSNGIVVYYTCTAIYSESTYQVLKDAVKQSF